MGIETFIILGLTAMQAIGTMNAAEDEAQATVDQANIDAENKSKETRFRAARAQASFLNSGLTLDGTPMAVIQDTFNTGIADINQITTNANKSAKNTIRAGRMEAIGQIAGAVGGMSFGGGDMFSGSGTFGAQGSVSRGIAGMNDATIGGITSTDAYGPMKSFGGF